VDERRGAQRERASLPPQVVFGEAMQLVVEEREEPFRGLRIRGVGESDQCVELPFHLPGGCRATV